MPEIRRKGSSSIPRSVSPQLAGFRGSAQLEGEAIQNLGKVVSNNVVGLMEDIKQVNDRVKQEELSNEMQDRMSKSLQELSVVKPEDAPDGSDLEERARSSFQEIQADVLGKASSGNVKDALALQSQDLGRAFDGQVFNMANKRFLNHTENKLRDFSATSGNKILEAPASAKGALMLGEISKYNSLLDELAPRIGVDVADKFKRSHLEEMQKTFVESAELDENSASTVLMALKGKSGDPALDKTFESMDPSMKTRALMKVGNIIERQTREFEQRVQYNLNELKAKNLMGESFDPALATKLAADVKGSAMDPADKQKALSQIAVETKANDFSLSKVNMNTPQMLEYLKQSIDSFQGSSQDKLEYSRRLIEIGKAEIELRKEDPKAAVDRVKAIQVLKDSADTPKGFLEYNQKVLETQKAMGLAQSLLSKDESASIASAFNSIGTVQGRTHFLDEQLSKYGSMGTKFLNELSQRKDIPDNYAFYGALSSPSSKEAFIRNSLNVDVLKDENISEKYGVYKSDINKSVRDELLDVTDSLSRHSGMSSLNSQIFEQVKAEAKNQIMLGKDHKEAAKIAKDKIFSENFKVVSSGMSNLIVPTVSAGGSMVDPRRVETFLDASLDKPEIKALNLDSDLVEWRQNPSNTDELQLFEGNKLVVKKDKAGNVVPITESISRIANYSSDYEVEINKRNKGILAATLPVIEFLNKNFDYQKGSK